jgi:hypothetical protein
MRLKLALIAITAIAVSACALLGGPPLESFGDRLAAGYATVRGARQFNTALLNGQRIHSSDAENMQKQLDAAREGLDVASTLCAPPPGACGLDAEDKLQTTMTIANAALGYLCKKNPTDANCLSRSPP